MSEQNVIFKSKYMQLTKCTPYDIDSLFRMIKSVLGGNYYILFFALALNGLCKQTNDSLYTTTANLFPFFTSMTRSSILLFRKDCFQSSCLRDALEQFQLERSLSISQIFRRDSCDDFSPPQSSLMKLRISISSTAVQ